MPSTDVNRTVEAVWRIESGRLIAGLARMTGDVGLAEDLAQEALIAALESWSRDGVPPNPGAWLMTTAKNRAIDGMRRAERFERRREELGRDLELRGPVPPADAALDEIGDDLLSLIFTCCHPVLSREARVALTLRLLGGLRTDEIARAFLVPSATIGQRISRAKKTLTQAEVPFEVPAGNELTERFPPVLEVIYLIFNEGYSATAGEDWVRPALCEDAQRLGRVLAELAPREREVHGLVALMELQASRLGARVDGAGRPILLPDQDRSRWDLVLIGRGLRALDRAAALDGEPGPYELQAEIAACHARTIRSEETDWQRISELYDVLSRTAPSPVVELNRAMALAMAEGAQAGLDLVDEIAATGALDTYYLLPAVRGDLLSRLEREPEAQLEFTRAASLTDNDQVRSQLLARAGSPA